MSGIVKGRGKAEATGVATILCIDDQAAGLLIRKELLETKGYGVLIATNGPQALAMARQRDVDLVILDYRMPEMDGEEIASILKAEEPGRPIVLLTGYPGEIPQHLLALVDALVEKGNSASVLLSAVERALSSGRRRPGKQGRLERKRDSA